MKLITEEFDAKQLILNKHQTGHQLSTQVRNLSYLLDLRFRKPEFDVYGPLVSGGLQRGRVWECRLNVFWKISSKVL